MNDADQTILRSLIECGNDFASGSFLAEKLGISRVAIWSRIDKLREFGCEIEARRGKGYRLHKLPEKLNAPCIRACLPDRWKEIPIHFCESINSTNSEAARIFTAGEMQPPFIVIAREQTAGRGRLGRRWFSSSNSSLYVSFLFKPELSPREMQTFTLWMGTALCDFINREKEIPVRLKWPNDLLLDGKKFGGMLTEARIDHDRIRDLVFGIGLNVNTPPEELPEELQSRATSLAAAGQTFPLNEFAAAIIHIVLDGFHEFTNGENENQFRQNWKRYDALFGLPVTAQRGAETVSGIARGIDETGSLLLQQPDGSLQKVSAGDVTLRKTGL